MSEHITQIVNKYLTALLGIIFSIAIALVANAYANVEERVTQLERDSVVKDVKYLKESIDRIESRVEKISNKLGVN